MPKSRVILGPYSRLLRRGAIGSSIDGRSTTGRFMRDLEAQLVAHVGGKPTVPERLLINRIVQTALLLEVLDGKVRAGAWTEHDDRAYGAATNRQRLLLRELGMKGEPARIDPLAALHAHLAGPAE